MTEKRFTLRNGFTFEMANFQDNGKDLSFHEVLSMLNALHEENTELKSRIRVLNGANTILKELNTQLKQDNKHFNDKITELHWENHQITTRIETIKNTIEEAYQTERTELGQSVLKQLMEKIQ